MITLIESGLFMLGIAGLLTILARRLKIPAPVLLVTAGLLFSLVPGLPRIAFNPELVLFFFLPPLVYSAAIGVSWTEFREHLRPITWLAITLVLVTTAGVAVAAHTLIPNLSWPAAFVLGAVISPPDEVAIVGVAQRLGFPRSLQTILEGEGLVNDAAALIAFRFAVAAVVTGAFSPGKAVLEFGAIVIGETCFGIFVGWIMSHLRRRIKETVVEVTFSLLTPYLAYLPAEHLGGSGVLATVAAGLYVSWHGPKFIASQTRLRAQGFWEIIVFLLDSLLFLLTGLQIRAILGQLSHFAWPTLLLYAAAMSLLVIVIRFAWVFLTAPVARLPGHTEQESKAPWQHVFLTAWAGIRGAISLAAALAIPMQSAKGAPFPARSLIVFLTLAVIMTTLVLQGLPLAYLLKKLGITQDRQEERREEEQEELEARLKAAEAALASLQTWAKTENLPQESVEYVRSQYERRIQRYKRRLNARIRAGRDGSERSGEADIRLWNRARRVERQTLLALRDDGNLSEPVHSRIVRDLDLDETRYNRAGG